MKRILFILLFAVSASAQFVASSGGGHVETSPYEFDILTLEADDSFTLPLYNGGTYNFIIDWGDSNIDTVTAYDDADITHTYEDEGASTYSISISGTLVGWKFDNSGDDLLMKDITQWGIFRPGNTGDWFKGCALMIITATDRLNLSGVTDMSEAFALCQAITTIPGINDWDVSNVTTFYGMFHTCYAFTSDIGDWDTGACTNFGYMFYHCDVWNQDIGGWDTGSMTQCTWMFYDAGTFNQDISGWDVGGVSNFDQMFRNAVSFDQNLSAWDITGMTSAVSMFFGVTLSTANYSALLIGWEAQTENADVTFGAGSSQYSAGAAATAKAALETNGWIITDGGQEEE